MVRFLLILSLNLSFRQCFKNIGLGGFQVLGVRWQVLINY